MESAKAWKYLASQQKIRNANSITVSTFHFPKRKNSDMQDNPFIHLEGVVIQQSSK